MPAQGSLHTVGYDVRGGPDDVRMKIRRWAHAIGGYYYFQFQDKRWGAMPESTIVIPLTATPGRTLAQEFEEILKDEFDATVDHICVNGGAPAARVSEVLNDVPAWAKNTAIALADHKSFTAGRRKPKRP